MKKPFLSGISDDQPTDPATLPHRRVLMVLGSGFEDAEAACALDILGWTHYRPSVATVDTVVTGLHETVSAAFGLKIAIDLSLDGANAQDFDGLIIPGGFFNLGFEEIFDERIFTLIKDFNEADKPIVTLCVGILPLAKAGVLQGGHATTFALSSRHDNESVLSYAGCEATGATVEVWNNIVSCSGPAFAEKALMIFLELLVGSKGASEVERYRRGLKH